MLEFKPFRLSFEEILRKGVAAPGEDELDVNIQLGISLDDEVSSPYRLKIEYEAVLRGEEVDTNTVILRVVALCAGELTVDGEAMAPGLTLDEEQTAFIGREAVKFAHPQISLISRQLDTVMAGENFALPAGYPPELKKEDIAP